MQRAAIFALTLSGFLLLFRKKGVFHFSPFIMDAIYILLIAVLFGLSFLLVKLFGRI